MTTRRQKAKQQLQQSKLQEQQQQLQKDNMSKGCWKENLGTYLIDISKYVLTGVIITSLFKDMQDKWVLYVLGIVIVLVALIVGLILTNDKDKKEK